MNLDAYLLNVTTPRELAEKLGCSLTSLSFWRHKRRPVPILMCVKIERITRGEVTRKDLRPDWSLIWPEKKRATHPSCGR